MLDEGGTSDHTFSIVLPECPAGTVLRYYVQATATDSAGTLAFHPEGAEHDVHTHVVTCPQAAYCPIVFNEIMAKNVAVVADPQGQYDDWIELKNIGDRTLELSGMYLSDRADHPLKWRFPDGVSVGPGQYLMVWADENGEDTPGLHANFKLSAQGETIWLYDTAQNGHALLDSVTFAAMAGDQSLGRYPDGTGPMQTMSVPSPEGSNAEPARSE